MKKSLLLAGVLPLLVSADAWSLVVGAEYFIDEDPGQGNGTLVVLPASGDTVAGIVELPTGEFESLSAGMHRIGVRFLDIQGDWSEAFSRTFSKDTVPEMPAPVTVVAAEYFIDTDPGVGLGAPVQVGIPGDVADFTIQLPIAEFAALSEGHHRLGIRTKDSIGNWSEAFARTFGKDPADAPLPESLMDRVEYQWHGGNGPVSGTFSSFAPLRTDLHTWLPDLPVPQGAEGDIFQLVITPYDTQGARGDSVTRNVKLAPPPILAEVLSQAFPGANPQDLSPTGNPLGDTLNNLQKYYLGLDPTRRSGESGLSVVSAGSSGAGGVMPRAVRSSMEESAPVALRYTRNRYVRNVRGTVEASISLAGDSWMPVVAVEEVTPLDPYTDQVTLRPIPPSNSAGRQFFRLVVEETP